jgi:tetratricopeptide (TPR) repeat protein
MLQSHYGQAVGYYQQCLSGHQRPADRTANTLGNLSLAEMRQGRYREATGALDLNQSVGGKAGEVETLNVFGAVYLEAGQPAQARGKHAAALRLGRELGERYEQARAHDGLGQCWFATGDRGQARQHWEQALALYTDMGTPEAEAVRGRLKSC